MGNEVKQQLSNYGKSTAEENGEKIRVLLVITRLTIGGDTNVVLDIASNMNIRPDFEVDLAVGPVPEGEVDLTHLAIERGIKTHYIPNLINRISPVSNIKAVIELWKLIVRGKYQIVHTHSSMAGVAGRTAAFLAGVPVILHHVHGWGLQPDMSAAQRLVYLTMERFCALFTDRLIGVSKSTIEKGVLYKVALEKRFTLIYNGISLEKFRGLMNRQDVLLKLGLDPDCKIVGMIGRLDKQKNPLDFIRSAAIVANSYPKVQFIIAGEGVLRAECEKLIRELNLECHFFLLGFRNDIHEILGALTLTALSSLWEGLPVVFQESMSAGKPVVANDVDGARDVIIDGKTGFLVQPHNPQEMAERILLLLKNDDFCREMGENARRESEQYSTDRMIQNIESLYRGMFIVKKKVRGNFLWRSEI
jgi:glycosyltransferase involved in cell wall biosynthesis